MHVIFQRLYALLQCHQSYVKKCACVKSPNGSLEMATTRKAPCDNLDVASTPLAKKWAGEGEAALDSYNSSSNASVYVPVFEKATLEQLMYYDRPCSAGRSGQRCWLSVEMCPWNRVLHDLGFELVEHKPGKVSLQSMPYAKAYKKHCSVYFNQSSCLLTRLLERHCCIDVCKLFSRKLPSNADCADNPNEKSYPIRLAAPLRDGPIFNIRSLKLVLSKTPEETPDEAPKHHVHVFEGLHAVAGLEELVIDCPEINFKFSLELEALLRRNASTLKTVKILIATLPRNVYRALQFLINCESLTFYPCLKIGSRIPTTDSVAQLLCKTNTLKKVSVCSVVNDEQLTTLAEAINACKSLTKVTMHITDMSCSPKALFTALGSNTTLKKLQLKEGIIDETSGQALAFALENNTCLRTLEFEDSIFCASGMTHLAGALMINTTLKELHMTVKLPMALVQQLCEALAVNKTLKKLTFGSFDSSMQERVFLAKCLAQDNYYGRVQLPWSEPDIPGLTAVVVCPELCPEELSLPAISHISAVNLRPLLQAISISKRIHTFKTCLEGDAGAKGAAVCEMLKATHYITTVELGVEHDEGGQFHDLMHALVANRSITVATITVHAISRLETAEDLSYFLSHNTTVSALAFYSDSSFSTEFVKELSKGMWRNSSIVEFVIAPKLRCTDESFTTFEAVRRNKGALNRAVDFILQHKADRLCAEGFEMFAGKPCQLDYVAKLSGKTEAEAVAAVISALHFLRDYYLVITGVVQNSVTCHPAKHTQLDSLNSDCWRAIARYLSVDDVLCPVS
ncbi:uncharacterized protein LOC119456192 [Dermacentor silvarum]|nr:uncharacterized protein LOC119456192 [Dermacentor silvarum]